MLYSLLSALIFTTSITGLIRFRHNIIPRFLIVLTNFTLVFLFASEIGQETTFLMLLCSILIVWVFSTGGKKNIILAFMGYIFSICLNFACSITAMWVFKIPLRILSTRYANIFSLIFLIFEVIIMVFFNVFLMQKEIFTKTVTTKAKLSTYFALNLFCCVLIFILNFVIDKRLNYPMQFTYFNLFVYTLTFFLSTSFLYMMYKNLVSEHQKELAQFELQQLKDNNLALEKHYDRLLEYRHDNQNILLSLKAFIDQNDMESLTEYYNSILLTMNQPFEVGSSFLHELSNIEQLELRSILSIKTSVAHHENLDVFINIPQKVERLWLASYDSVRVVSILLDNAIEASSETTEKKLFISIVQLANYQTIRIMNSTPQIVESVNNLYQKGITTKSYGNGLGLRIIDKILSTYPTVLLETTYKNNFFIQTLNIAARGA